MICSHCNRPVPANELVTYKMHENCWIDMLIDLSIIEPLYAERPNPMLLDSKVLDWLRTGNRTN